MAKPELVPYDADGNLVRTPQYVKHVVWKPNPVFKARLILEPGLKWGASSKHVVWRDADNHAFPMFNADLLVLCLTGCIIAGRCVGPWMVTKRGTAYGLVYIRERMVTPERPVIRYQDATKEVDVQD